MADDALMQILMAMALSEQAPEPPPRPSIFSQLGREAQDTTRLRREALAAALGQIAGLKSPGNVDLFKQPIVPNPDGTTSTVDSFSVNIDGREVLLPTVTPDGRHLSEEEAIREHYRTGRHLGLFDTPQNATRYASQLHDDYAAGKYQRKR